MLQFPEMFVSPDNLEIRLLICCAVWEEWRWRPLRSWSCPSRFGYWRFTSHIGKMDWMMGGGGIVIQKKAWFLYPLWVVIRIQMNIWFSLSFVFDNRFYRVIYKILKQNFKFVTWLFRYISITNRFTFIMFMLHVLKITKQVFQLIVFVRNPSQLK